MENYPNSLTIKSWAEADRPREKLLLKGKFALSEAELIAILIRSGNKNLSAVELAKNILNSVNNDLNELGKLSVNDLIKFKGMGEAKALSIIAALELDRRRRQTNGLKKEKIITSKDAVEIFEASLSDLRHEEFWVLFLSRGNKIIAKQHISSGGMVGTVVDVKLIFKWALDHLASSIILCHNHPSGKIEPSQEDRMLTGRLHSACNALGIRILDHLIVGDNQFFSFKEHRLL